MADVDDVLLDTLAEEELEPMEVLEGVATQADREYDDCNGPRDCSGTERGCRHCGPGARGLHILKALLAAGLTLPSDWVECSWQYTTFRNDGTDEREPLYRRTTGTEER